MNVFGTAAAASPPSPAPDVERPEGRGATPVVRIATTEEPSPEAAGGPLGTARRKLARSIAEHGLLRTGARLVAFPARIAVRLLRELTPERRRHRRRERAFDARHGVDTRRDRDPGWMARIPSPNWRYDRGYAPARVGDLTAALDGLDLEPERFTFVDVGAGKGRALLIAAERPFRRVIGVEYAPRLCAVAAANLKRWKSPDRRCDEVSIIEADAARWEFPLAPLVVFFHHPFDEPVFRLVLENLERSLADLPRPVVVVYLDPQCGHLFDDSPWFRRRPAAGGPDSLAVFDFVGGVRRISRV